MGCRSKGLYYPTPYTQLALVCLNPVVNKLTLLYGVPSMLMEGIYAVKKAWGFLVYIAG